MSRIKRLKTIYCTSTQALFFWMPSHLKEHHLFPALCTSVVLSFRTTLNEVYQHKTVNISFGYQTRKQKDEVLPLCNHYEYIINVQ
jgi:hypothetical protein